MTFEPTPLEGSYVVHLHPYNDERGWFVRTFSKDEFAQIAFSEEWLQMNHSFTSKKATLRGMHYQLPPFREIKLVRCIKGCIYDVIVDIRAGSPTFLKSFSIELKEHDMQMLYIPEGFAHGFQTLTDNCEVIYHHSKKYQPGFEGGLRYDDPMLGMLWPEKVTVISERDKNHPFIQNDFKGI